MSNLLSEVHPELVLEWSERNLPLTPDKITYGSNKIVWWIGTCGHEWQTSVKARSSGEKCPICSGARAVEGINDLVTLKPELAAEWSSKNNPLKPTMVTVGSHKKVIWKGKCGHEWTATVKSRAISGTGCPYCSHNKVLEGFNDLASQRPLIASEWSERNYPLKPNTGSLLMGGNWFCQTMYGGWLEDNFDQGLSEIGFISAAFGLAVFVGSLLCLTLTDKLGKTKAMKLGAIVTICGGVIAAFTNQKSLIIGSIGLFLYFAFVEFATEACISLCTDVRAEIRGTVIGSSFGALAIGSTIGTGVSPVLYTKFGYTPCIIVGTVIVAIALLVIAKVLTPGFANKEKN